MKLDRRFNRGIELYPGTRISNGSEVRSEILHTKLLQGTAGVHSINEFYDTVYYFKKGEFPDISTYEEMDDKGTSYTFYFLRESQGFVTDLWGVKDNGIYVRDGFLITYQKEIEEGTTFKASLSEMFSDASAERGEFEFTRKEVEMALQTFEPFTIDDISESDMGMKYPNFDHFYKNKAPERMQKAHYFTLGARNNSALPMKIVLYCTALECLFSTAKTEINHRIAERIATMLGTSAEEKKDLFKFIKKAYDYRSTIIHGSNIRGSEKTIEENIVRISVRLDEILRQLLAGNHEVFTKAEEEIDDFFVDLIFD